MRKTWPRFVRRLALLGSALITGAAVQAAPVALSISPGFSLQPYHGAMVVNAGRIDTDNTLFFVREAQRQGVQSWYLVFEPEHSQRVRAKLDFGAPISGVVTDFAGLLATQALFGVDIDGDGQMNDYARSKAMGLEPIDVALWSAGDSWLTIDWRARNPGDHVRVFTQALAAPAAAVPEPGTLALVLLPLLGLAARRRRTR